MSALSVSFKWKGHFNTKTSSKQKELEGFKKKNIYIYIQFDSTKLGWRQDFSIPWIMYNIILWLMKMPPYWKRPAWSLDLNIIKQIWIRFKKNKQKFIPFWKVVVSQPHGISYLWRICIYLFTRTLKQLNGHFGQLHQKTFSDLKNTCVKRPSHSEKDQAKIRDDLLYS